MPTQPPWGVNLMAFFSRFQNTCCRRAASAWTTYGASGPMSTPKCRLRASMSGRQTSTARWMIVAQRHGLLVQFDLAPRDAGHVQQVVDQPGFQFHVAADHLQRLAGARRPARGSSWSIDDGRQHRRQRRAQLVAEHRQEVVLGLAGLLGGGLGLLGGHLAATSASSAPCGR